jgi:hypothetical protein
MKQVRMWVPVALSALLALSAVAATRVEAAPRKSTATSAAAKRSAVALHQFSGVVTALDRNSLTVEKGGKKARSMVFSRHPEMKTSGDLEKDARVTVWYRDEDGHPVAHKVVVKSATLSAQR